MPWFQIISYILVAAIAVYWMKEGFFSGMIHLACVIAAAAIAFSVWEPTSYFLLSVTPARGTGAVLGDIAWGLGLAFPFAVALGLLRLAANAVVPFNAQCDKAVEYIGGTVTGLASAIITVGILVMSVGFMRIGSEFGGYTSVGYTTQVATGNGSVERRKEFFQPYADKWTGALMERLSLASFRTGDPLAKWYPGVADVPSAMRLTYENSGRNTMGVDDFDVLGWYTVGAGQGFQGGKLDERLTDGWNQKAQKVIDLDGEPMLSGYIAGFPVNFKSGAKERQGQVVIGVGQVRLLCESQTDEDWIVVHPAAVVANVDAPDKVELARFRYDAQNVFIASVGATSEALMAFEFPVPTGYRPVAIYVKNIRVDVSDQNPTRDFETTQARDAAIRSKVGDFFKP